MAGQAGTDEIEVTPEMIEAGARALREQCPMDFAFPVGLEEIAVEAVLRAALQVRPRVL